MGFRDLDVPLLPAVVPAGLGDGCVEVNEGQQVKRGCVRAQIAQYGRRGREERGFWWKEEARESHEGMREIRC
jgi:hypothetical protein